MPHYETVLIMRQDLSPVQAESIATKTQENLTQAKAHLDRVESWGLRTLAYPIRKNRKGHYFIINHTNESQITQEMQRTLSLNEDMLRILTIKTAEPETQPTPMAARIQRELETSESPRESSSSRYPSRPFPRSRTTETSETKEQPVTETETQTETQTKSQEAKSPEAPTTQPETEETQETS